MKITRSVRRTLAALCIFSVMAGASGCFGAFMATRKLWSFNNEISGNKFLNWLVFLGLVIIPAYELFALGDALIFNSIEFWGGSNPLAQGPSFEEKERLVRISDTDQLRLVRGEEQGSMTAELIRDGRVISVRHFEVSEDGFTVTDEHGAEVARVRRMEDGSVVVSGAGKEPLAIHSAADIERLVALYKDGGAPMLAEQLLSGGASVCAARP